MRDRFRVAGIDTPELDAKLLAQQILALGPLDLVSRERDLMPAEAFARFEVLAERRLAGEPIARILGEKDFYGLTFTLNAATLVPRPETELLVDLGLSFLAGRPAPAVLDLGTGSGCIAIALLHECPQAGGIAIDLSPEALKAAHTNSLRQHVADRLQLRQGSWFAPLSGETFDLIVSNPPYIESGIIPTLQPEVRDFDPLLALDGGPDGLAPYRIIATKAGYWLRPNGAVMVETGSGQGPEVARLMRAAGLSDVAIKKDLAGLDRVVIAHHS